MNPPHAKTPLNIFALSDYRVCFKGSRGLRSARVIYRPYPVRPYQEQPGTTERPPNAEYARLAVQHTSQPLHWRFKRSPEKNIKIMKTHLEDLVPGVVILQGSDDGDAWPYNRRGINPKKFEGMGHDRARGEARRARESRRGHSGVKHVSTT